MVRTSQEPVRAEESPVYFADEAAARRFIGGLLLDGDASRELGRLYHRLDVGAFIDLTGEQVVNAIALQLAAGTIRVTPVEPVCAPPAALTRVLPVPYFAQPTGNTCQSTCLKMMAAYLEETAVRDSTGASALKIVEIQEVINGSKERPDKRRNAHANLKWWLECRFPTLTFDYLTFSKQSRALKKIIEFIDGDRPVLVSVSHANVEGHIILVVGYENYAASGPSPGFNIVAHDPYGRFDPTLLSKTFGARRFEGGMSLMSERETGPGENCRVPLTSVSRQREDDDMKGTFYLLAARP
ncbi:MAG: C39 family peptidase [Gemmatimonadota bacterium]|nr:C39 family peptidase [Gemmatimonadota bacterium]